MTRYLLDTNIVSELRRRKPHGAVVEWISRLNAAQICLSAVTVGELQCGIERTRRQDPVKARDLEVWLESLLLIHDVLPMDAICFREWARLMDRKSETLSEDAMVAATARVHNLIVATRNVRHFQQLEVEIANPFEPA